MKVSGLMRCTIIRLEKEMATHFSILAWEIPRKEESGGLQSMEMQRSMSTHTIIMSKIKSVSFIKNNFIYLFVLAALCLCCTELSLIAVNRGTLYCSVQASHCGSISPSGAWAPGCRGFRTCGTQ